MIGVLTGREGVVPTAAFFRSNLRMTGITVGSLKHQEAFVRAIESTGLQPAIDSVFPVEQHLAAIERQTSQRHVGKIVINFD